MANIIIIAVIAVLVILGIRSSITHFRGEGGCCGGGSSVKPKRKKLKKILFTREFHVDGMHCSHCKNAVEAAVNTVDAVAGKVNLKENKLTVSYAEDVPNETILEAIAKAGYQAQPL